MEVKKPTMKNIQLYLTTFIKKRCEVLFKDFLPPTYTPLVQKNSIGDSEFTSPCATQIFNMCNKKANWQYTSIEQLAEAFIKDLKDEEGIISEFKIVVQEPVKKLLILFEKNGGDDIRKAIKSYEKDIKEKISLNYNSKRF